MKHYAVNLSAWNWNQALREGCRASPCSTCEHPPAAEAVPQPAQQCRGIKSHRIIYIGKDLYNHL